MDPSGIPVQSEGATDDVVCVIVEGTDTSVTTEETVQPEAF